MKRFELRPASRELLVADHHDNLEKGRAFVAGAGGVVERERCEIAIVHPESEDELLLEAEAVWITSDGVGFAVLDLSDERKQELAAFVSAGAPARDAPPARHVQERIRSLTLRERDELARRGSLVERVALERIYGTAVWESLLQNPQLTPPEVARIARNGTLSKPLVAVIAGNPAWLAHGEVQRALLSNPRCTGPHVERVLRAMKPTDLARLAKQCPYRAEVRAPAQRLARG